MRNDFCDKHKGVRNNALHQKQGTVHNIYLQLVYLITGAIIGDGERKRGFHAAPSKMTNVLFLDKLHHPQRHQRAWIHSNLRVQRGRAGYDR